MPTRLTVRLTNGQAYTHEVTPSNPWAKSIQNLRKPQSISNWAAASDLTEKIHQVLRLNAVERPHTSLHVLAQGRVGPTPTRLSNFVTPSAQVNGWGVIEDFLVNAPSRRFS
jgi:hypothetical protein